MSVLSKFGTGALIIAAGVCTLAFVYFLRKNRDATELEYQDFISTRGRQTVLELPVPRKLVGGIIGRQGANVKSIEKSTNTRINFRDKDEEHNIIVIRGQAACVQQAEAAIKLAMQEQGQQVTITMVIPSHCCGRVIGKGGSSIRMLCDQSKAKITIERESGNLSKSQNSMREVTIVGTKEATELAKTMVENIVLEEREFQLRTSNRLDNGHGGQRRLKATEEEVDFDEFGGKVERLISSASDGFIEAFMSAVDTPHRFWVQPVGASATELDKLNDEMTTYYKIEENRELNSVTELKIGDLVAAQFPYDDMWYRARVVDIETNEYDDTESSATVYFGDFGETGITKQTDLCMLLPGYQQLPFQAVEGTLVSVRPEGDTDTWSEESTQTFKLITYATQWKKIMVRSYGTMTRDKTQVYLLEIVDTTGKYDVNIAEELVKRGLAKRDTGDWDAKADESDD